MQLSDAEWRILDAVWQRSPATVRDVMNRLAGRSTWAYTTVKTMLTRLVDKGALDSCKRDNVTYFTACLSRQQAQRIALRTLLDRAFDGALPPLVEFALTQETLSTGERDALTDLIRRETAATSAEG